MVAHQTQQLFLLGLSQRAIVELSLLQGNGNAIGKLTEQPHFPLLPLTRMSAGVSDDGSPQLTLPIRAPIDENGNDNQGAHL